MANIEDDVEYFEVTIIVPEGNADIVDIEIPYAVNANTPFDIKYDV